MKKDKKVARLTRKQKRRRVQKRARYKCSSAYSSRLWRHNERNYRFDGTFSADRYTQYSFAQVSPAAMLGLIRRHEHSLVGFSSEPEHTADGLRYALTPHPNGMRYARFCDEQTLQQVPLTRALLDEALDFNEDLAGRFGVSVRGPAIPREHERPQELYGVRSRLAEIGRFCMTNPFRLTPLNEPSEAEVVMDAIPGNVVAIYQNDRLVYRRAEDMPNVDVTPETGVPDVSQFLRFENGSEIRFPLPGTVRTHYAPLSVDRGEGVSGHLQLPIIDFDPTARPSDVARMLAEAITKTADIMEVAGPGWEKWCAANNVGEMTQGFLTQLPLTTLIGVRLQAKQKRAEPNVVKLGIHYVYKVPGIEVVGDDGTPMLDVKDRETDEQREERLSGWWRQVEIVTERQEEVQRAVNRLTNPGAYMTIADLVQDIVAEETAQQNP